MKKIFTLIMFSLAVFTFKTVAQNTTCNAAFTFAISGLSINFTSSLSSDNTTIHHYWKFGDGTISSEVSPVHVYQSAGTFTVKHYFYKSENGSAVCIDSVEKKVELIVVSNTCSIHAGFSFERDASQPKKFYFHNHSTPASDVHAVKWIFGDGTFSYDFNTSHVYANPGLFTVCLIIGKDNTCQRDTCAHVQVETTPLLCNLEADFSSHTDSLQQNKIHFNNLSAHFENGDSIRWTFGDGGFSYDGSPTHIYALPGIYNVCIRIKKNTYAGSSLCVKEACKQVVVPNECRLQAGFNAETDVANKNKIYFKNLSTPLSSITNVQWNFGDGNTSKEINPDHIYSHAGSYNVCLKITSGNNCYNEFCKTVEIKESELGCADISKFTIIKSAVNCLEFKFIPETPKNDWKYIWSFGDGTGSNEMIPAGHVYPRSGNYTVYLTVFKSSDCVSTSHKIVETGTCFSCNNIWVRYEYHRENSASNKLYFHTISNYPVLSQTFTITKLSSTAIAPVIINQANPVYSFTEPGDYRVCIRAVTAGQCVKEYCEVIHISSLHTECILTAYPNPANNQVSFNVLLTQPEVIHVYIYNSINILIMHKELPGNTGNNVVTNHIEGLIHGAYHVKIVYGKKACYSMFQKI